jgi:putative transposase
MKRSKFSPNQIVKILREYDSGKTAIDVCRDHGISQATLYNWKKRYGGMEASDLKRLKALEEENTKLKRMYAELALDHEMAKEIIAKKL